MRECMLVDTGWHTAEGFNMLEGQIKELGLDFDCISQIVITHAHPDHCGMAGKLRQLCPARLALHHIERELTLSWYVEGNRSLQRITHWLHSNGMPAEEVPMLAESSVFKDIFTFPAEVMLYGGEVLTAGSFQFEVLWTPGHSPGHICLYEPRKRILISGDHILPITTPHIGLYPFSGKNPLQDYLDSLARLKGLDVDLILPGHEHVFQGLQHRIEELLQHHREREAAIADKIKGEPKTAYQVASEVPWMLEMGGIMWHDLSTMNKRLALMETLSHLEFLRAKGEAERISKGGVILYHHG
jgi:glyoxylase-like metal-dependent hydrolase (beta-lactamase superfamily II)